MFKEEVNSNKLIIRSFDIISKIKGIYSYSPKFKRIKNKISLELSNLFYSLNFKEIETSIIGPEELYKRSKHLSNFQENNLSLMYSLSSKEKLYLRPELAQGIIIYFLNYYKIDRKLNYGLFEVGKCFRYELKPQNTVIRLREFTIQEGEFFYEEKYEKEMGEIDLKLIQDYNFELDEIKTNFNIIDNLIKNKIIRKFLIKIICKLEDLFFKNILKENLVIKINKDPTKLAHYSELTIDFEIFSSTYNFYVEIGAIAFRSNNDFKNYKEISNVDKINIIEPTFGLERLSFLVLEKSYKVDNKRTYYYLSNSLREYDYSIFVIKKNDIYFQKREELISQIKKRGLRLDFEYVGKNYYESDQNSIEWSICVDEITLIDNSFTIRNIINLNQKRVSIEEFNLII